MDILPKIKKTCSRLIVTPVQDKTTVTTFNSIMKKLAKCCLMVFALVTLCVGFQGCSDDDSDNDAIVGKWQCDYDAYGDEWDEPLILFFDDDGTGYEWFSDEPFSYRSEFTYVVKSSSKIRIMLDDDETYDLKYKISNNGNTLYLYNWDDDDMEELQFKRIK